MGAEAAAVGWGTWEELILGGAVLRHGTQDWKVVASELRGRTLYPYTFTPQACKARYEDLQRRYSGSTAWFEELRKQRVAELKRELAKSEDSIGETSNNENSAGSFTKDTNTRASWSCENRDQAVVTDIKPSTSVSSEDDKDLCVKKLAEAGYGRGVVMRKRRGQRNRKDCNRTIKERSASVSDNLCSNVISTAQKEPSRNDCSQIIRDSGNNHRYGDSCPVRKDSLIEIFKSVAESEPAAVFRHRMDSQESYQAAHGYWHDKIKNHRTVGQISKRTLPGLASGGKQCARLILVLPCKDKVSEKVYVVENVVPANPVGLDKQCDFDDNVSQSSLLKDRKGLKRPGKLKRGLSDSPSKNRAVKQRKRVRR
ncbi:hypothetical protein DH2020_032842 [Rehmannia glutinosa]|uniref:Myb-like domain-containing protein n=1 Tax=Rehmannia glutinosa TaxID=99300 RepID=A0ABR0VE09_REHGL